MKSTHPAVADQGRRGWSLAVAAATTPEGRCMGSSAPRVRAASVQSVSRRGWLYHRDRLLRLLVLAVLMARRLPSEVRYAPGQSQQGSGQPRRLGGFLATLQSSAKGLLMAYGLKDGGECASPEGPDASASAAEAAQTPSAAACLAAPFHRVPPSSAVPPSSPFAVCTLAARPWAALSCPARTWAALACPA